MEQLEEMPIAPTFPPKPLNEKGEKLTLAEEILRLEGQLKKIKDEKKSGLGMIGDRGVELVQEEGPIVRRLAQLRSDAEATNIESGV